MKNWKARIPLAWFSLSLGFGLILSGCLLLYGLPVAAQAQAETVPAAYVGSAECADCHRNHASSGHDLALFSPSERPEAVLGDFSAENPLLVLALPNEASARPVQLSDIAYVVGAGKHVQRYLVASDSGQYQVLPFEWNTATGQWQAYLLTEDFPNPAYDWNSHCADCHSTAYDANSQTWLEAGVQCESCHGAGSLHVETADDVGRVSDAEELALLRSSINSAMDSQVCGQCHSAGTSSTGQPYPESYQVGDDLLATFTLAPVTDPNHWWLSGHAKQPNMQFNEWLLSGHADAYNNLPVESQTDPLCLDCHSEGYRAAARLLTDSRYAEFLPEAASAAQGLGYDLTCSTCHNPHEEEVSTALLRDNADALCADCHTNGDLTTVHHPTVEMLTGASLIADIEGVSSAHSSGENAPTCSTCHMMTVPTGNESRTSHSFSPVLPSVATGNQSDTCTSCHTDLTRTYGERFITKQQEDVTVRLVHIEAALENQTAETWVLDALNFIRGDGSLGVHNLPYTEALLQRMEDELGLSVQSAALIGSSPVANPSDCVECHEEEHAAWLNSSHANASLQSDFREAYAANGQPTYCLRCHASGYDATTQSYLFEGVVCTSCHLMESGVEHPPATINLASDPAICGTCHSGGHASVYEEWLASEHYQAGIDCIDCHSAHDNGLLLGDVNSTCSDCHADAMDDEVHMSADMVCTDCHMTPRQTVDDPTLLSQTGHSMNIAPSVCADCHGEIHELSPLSSQDETSLSELEALQHQVEQLEEKADMNLNSGLFGGAIGLLIVLVFAYIVLRLGRRL